MLKCWRYGKYEVNCAVSFSAMARLVRSRVATFVGAFTGTCTPCSPATGASGSERDERPEAPVTRKTDVAFARDSASLLDSMTFSSSLFTV